MQKINKMYAWVATDEDGGEGIIAHMNSVGQWMPLVGADRARIEAHREFVVGMRKEINKPISLIEFSDRKVLEVLGADKLNGDEGVGFIYHDGTPREWDDDSDLEKMWRKSDPADDASGG